MNETANMGRLCLIPITLHLSNKILVLRSHITHPVFANRVALIIDFDLSLTCYRLQLATEIMMILVGAASFARAKGITGYLTRTDKLFDLFLTL